VLDCSISELGTRKEDARDMVDICTCYRLPGVPEFRQHNFMTLGKLQFRTLSIYAPWLMAIEAGASLRAPAGRSTPEHSVLENLLELPVDTENYCSFFL
jgi:hypothetical protein